MHLHKEKSYFVKYAGSVTSDYVINCRKPPWYVPYKGNYVPYDGTYGAPDQG